MPKINLSGTFEDRWWLMALMLFPDDPANRTYFLTLKKLEIELASAEDGDMFEVDVATLKNLVNCPSKAEMARLITEATKRAICTGDILASIYLMDHFSNQAGGFKRPSMNKAIHVSMQFGLIHKFGDGEPMHRSETKIRKCWGEFRSVAHLWAAHRLTQAYPLPSGPEPLPTQLGSNAFLTVAAGLYDFGTRFIPTGNRQELSILDHETSWRLPDSILPSKLAATQLPDELARYLETYKAE
jgi:hypothetical protein